MAGDDDLPVGDIQFYDNYQPSLDAGKYTIKVEQQIDGLDEPKQFASTQEFEVRAPQFAIDPADVHSVYPPADGSGPYANVLPNVVLSKRILPWERYLIDGDKTVPWLALLVFQADELTIDAKTNSPLVTCKVSDLLADSDTVLKPKLPTPDADVMTQRCQTVQVSYDVFRALAPRQDTDQAELPLLAHVRQVNTGNQEIGKLRDQGWFAVVTANRFPQSTPTGAKNYAMLVSLEGFAPYLLANSPKPKQQSVQLAVLTSWTFTCLDQAGASFGQLMKNLVEPTGHADPDLMLRLPGPTPGNGTSPADEAAQRLSYGYVPLAFQTPVGEVTFAWYRGPLVPVIPQKLPKTVDHFRTRSEAMIYDRTYGVFDHSYTAAWEIGRAIALSAQSFTVPLVRLRRNAHQLVNRLVDRLESVHLEAPQNLRQLLQNNLHAKAFESMIRAGLSESLTKAFQELRGTNVNAVGAFRATARTQAAQAAPGKTRVDVLRNFLARPDLRELLHEEVQQDLVPVAQWLANLVLLYGVPFNHLAADQRMLPVESIRFFYIDKNWTDALVDGALSVGVATSRDRHLDQLLRETIDGAIDAHIQVMRAKLAGTATGDLEKDSTKEARSGFLIRSAVVSGWPGLVVQGFQGEAPLKILRMDRLAPDVLFVMFLDIPDTVTLSEPQQGLMFGVEDMQNITLRSLDKPVGRPLEKAGNPISFPEQGKFSQFYRQVEGGLGSRVLNIAGAEPNLKDKLTAALTAALGRTVALTPADFAVQMVKAPEQMIFKKT